MWCTLHNILLNFYSTYCFSVNISMILLHCNLDGSLSRQVYLQVNFDLLLDHLDTFSSPYLLVFKLQSVPRVFVVLNSHKSFLFLCDLVNCTDVRFLFQYGVELELRGCYSNVRLGLSCSVRLIMKQCLHPNE